MKNRLFVAYFFITQNGQSGFGNCEVKRDNGPLTAVGGADGITALQAEIAQQQALQYCCVISWQELPEPSIQVATVAQMPKGMSVVG